MKIRSRAGFLSGSILLVVLTGVGCRGRHNRVTVQNEEDTETGIASVVHTNDPKQSTQLLSGFYGIEGNAWRWTSGKFSVLLGAPPAAAQRGATLSFSFTIPDVVSQKLGKITLTASTGGMVLKTAAYDKTGPQLFTAEVPANLLTAETVKVDFSLDKTIPPGNDQRELGIVASSIGLSSQ